MDNSLRESILRMAFSLLSSAKGHLQSLGMNETAQLLSEPISQVENELIQMAEPATPNEEVEDA